MLKVTTGCNETRKKRKEYLSVCDNCGADVRAYYKGRRFCSINCSREFRRQRNLYKGVEIFKNGTGYRVGSLYVGSIKAAKKGIDVYLRRMKRNNEM